MTNIKTCYAPGTVGLQVFPNPIKKSRNPATTDNNYPLGQVWINDQADIAWMLTANPANVANWVSIGGGAGGPLDTLTGTTGGALAPVGGTIIVTGNATQGVSVAGAGHTLTATVADWTTAQKGVGILSSDAQAVTGTGTTQAVTPHALTARLEAPGAIGGTTPAAGTFTVLTATTGDIVAALGDIEANNGDVSANGDVTAVTGDLVATNGNLVLVTAGNKIEIATGANASVGTSAAMVAGAVTVATTACSATAKVFYSRETLGGAAGHVSITAQNGTGFTLTSSSATETSTFNYWIINN